MSYKVADNVWLQTEADRVQAVILIPMYWHQEWTIPTIREALAANQKLEYTADEMTLIGQELIARGIIVEA